MHHLALTGSGPGSITIQASNAPTQTIPIPAFTAAATPVIFSPKELDFGIQTATSAPATRTITITNLTAQPQIFLSQQDTSNHSLPYTLTESASDCPLTGPSTKTLAAGATCHITLSLAASSTPANDGLISALWTIGPASSGRDVLVTGYTQAASLSLSASRVDFSTRYTGGLRQPRYLYLSNNSDATATHAAISSPSSSPFSIADRCPTQLEPRTICQLQIDYVPTSTPSIDSTTLSLDQGLTTLLTGQFLPQPNANGASVNPNLSVTPTTITFPNAVVVTTPSTATQTVTIGNTGATPFALAVSLTGDFTDTTNCAAILAANSTCTVVLTFTPSQPGPRQGILSVTAGAGTTPVYVTLNGTAPPSSPPTTASSTSAVSLSVNPPSSGTRFRNPSAPSPPPAPTPTSPSSS